MRHLQAGMTVSSAVALVILLGGCATTSARDGAEHERSAERAVAHWAVAGWRVAQRSTPLKPSLPGRLPSTEQSPASEMGRTTWDMCP